MNTIQKLEAEFEAKRKIADAAHFAIKEARRAEQRAKREAEKAAENAEIEEVKAWFADYHKLPRDAKFDLAWRIAWDRGHGSGMEEVKNYFEELIDLIKP